MPNMLVGVVISAVGIENHNDMGGNGAAHIL